MTNSQPEERSFDAVVLAVSHREFENLDVRSLLASDNGVVYDVKGVLPRAVVDGRL